MLTRRRRQQDDDAQKQADAEMTTLRASSDSHFLWPLPLFHPSNVLARDKRCWNSGVFAPASIRIHLGNTPVHVTRIALQAEMVPAMGNVSHQIRLGDTQATLRGVYWHNGICTDGEWMEINLPHRMSCLLEVVTHSSPSWVAWRRIRVWRGV